MIDDINPTPLEAVQSICAVAAFILCAPAPGTISAGGIQSYGSSVTIPVGTPLEKVEERLIAETLAQCGGDKDKAAKMLGVSARTLYRRAAK